MRQACVRYMPGGSVELVEGLPTSSGIVVRVSLFGAYAPRPTSLSSSIDRRHTSPRPLWVAGRFGSKAAPRLPGVRSERVI